ncbi:hypothetical protein [Bacillus aerolatus]|uniref:hypothetical protein n=1 Tax=Bacillus aerolatus TaxID=2653354 RepID=UPI00177B555A|nr:hypothetical protein [Bacillus aerolatus]
MENIELELDKTLLFHFFDLSSLAWHIYILNFQICAEVSALSHQKNCRRSSAVFPFTRSTHPRDDPSDAGIVVSNAGGADDGDGDDKDSDKGNMDNNVLVLVLVSVSDMDSDDTAADGVDSDMAGNDIVVVDNAAYHRAAVFHPPFLCPLTELLKKTALHQS